MRLPSKRVKIYFDNLFELFILFICFDDDEFHGCKNYMSDTHVDTETEKLCPNSFYLIN